MATGSSVVGGFINYAHVLLPVTRAILGPLLAVFVSAITMVLAYRDVQVSTHLMLWIEAGSVSMILIVLAYSSFAAAHTQIQSI